MPSEDEVLELAATVYDAGLKTGNAEAVALAQRYLITWNRTARVAAQLRLTLSHELIRGPDGRTVQVRTPHGMRTVMRDAGGRAVGLR